MRGPSLHRHRRLCFARQKLKVKVQKQDPAINRRGGAHMKRSNLRAVVIDGGLSRLSHELIGPGADTEGVDGTGANAEKAARFNSPA